MSCLKSDPLAVLRFDLLFDIRFDLTCDPRMDPKTDLDLALTQQVILGRPRNYAQQSHVQKSIAPGRAVAGKREEIRVTSCARVYVKELS